MHAIHVLSPSGDDTIEFDPQSPESVAEARGRFNALKEQGFSFYEGVKQTVVKRGRALTDFDPTVSTMIAVPKMSGGPALSFSRSID